MFFLITLPFRMIYWFVKIIWEIVEFIAHSSHHIKHRRHRSRHASPKQSNPATKLPTEIPDELANSVEQLVKRARDKRRKVESRLESYQDAFRKLDDIQSILRNDERKAFQSSLVDRLLREYKDLVAKNTTTNGMISTGPSVSIRTPADARRNGIKGAQWSSLDDSCPLCHSLDGKAISIDHPDFSRVVPPLHDGCKCIRVYIMDDEEGTDFDWVGPSEELLKLHAPHLLNH